MINIEDKSCDNKKCNEMIRWQVSRLTCLFIICTDRYKMWLSCLRTCFNKTWFIKICILFFDVVLWDKSMFGDVITPKVRLFFTNFWWVKKFLSSLTRTLNTHIHVHTHSHTYVYTYINRHTYTHIKKIQVLTC